MGDRQMPATQLGEREILVQWLEFHRATLLWKCEGLTPEQLKLRSVPPSSLSLLGLVRHCTEVERNWFQRTLQRQDVTPLYYSDADQDGDFDNAPLADVDGDFARFHEACSIARELTHAAGSLDVTGGFRESEVPVRW